MTDQKPPEMSWEAFIERRIEDAIEDGEFENLPGFGKPIPDIDEPYDETKWLRKKLEQERLSVLPPALEIRRDVEKTLDMVMQLRDERAVRRQLKLLNERIRAANFAAVWGPPSTTMPVDIDEVVERWASRRENG